MRISDWSSDVCSSDLDFFKQPNDKALYINVRPDCDVVIRENSEAPDMYLLKGKKVKDSKIDIGKYGQITDRDPQHTVFAMFGGSAYCFDFKKLQIGTWEDWKTHRKDRTSVVWGQSVSVSVDLGGRHILKKKKKSKE